MTTDTMNDFVKIEKEGLPLSEITNRASKIELLETERFGAHGKTRN